MRKLLILVLATLVMSSCAKLYDESYDENIERPQLDFEIPIYPPWDTIPQIDNDIDLEFKGSSKNSPEIKTIKNRAIVRTPLKNRK